MSYWFLLSGFACSRTYSTREDKWTSEFYRNRFARIAPLYWLTNALDTVSLARKIMDRRKQYRTVCGSLCWYGYRCLDVVSVFRFL